MDFHEQDGSGRMIASNPSFRSRLTIRPEPSSASQVTPAQPRSLSPKCYIKACEVNISDLADVIADSTLILLMPPGRHRVIAYNIYTPQTIAS